MPDSTIKTGDLQLFWKESYLRSMITGIICMWVVLLVVHSLGVKGIPYMERVVNGVILPLKNFAFDSWRLFNRCSKPSRKEFTKIACATGIGFCIMGFLGFFVKLVHIPINNIIVS